MTAFNLLAAGVAPAHLDIIKLFRDADIVVQVVMAGLLLASVWVWTIIVSFSVQVGRVKRRCRRFEDGFWAAKDMEAYQAENADEAIPSSRVVGAALGEWRRSLSLKQLARAASRATAGHSAARRSRSA